MATSLPSTAPVVQRLPNAGPSANAVLSTPTPPRPPAPQGSPNLFAERPFFNSQPTEPSLPRPRPAGPTPRPAQELPLVQRLPAPTQTGGEQPQPTRTVDYTPRPQTPPETGEAEKVELDLEKLARDVLPFIKRMLLVERERRPRR